MCSWSFLKYVFTAVNRFTFPVCSWFRVKKLSVLKTWAQCSTVTLLSPLLLLWATINSPIIVQSCWQCQNSNSSLRSTQLWLNRPHICFIFLWHLTSKKVLDLGTNFFFCIKFCSMFIINTTTGLFVSRETALEILSTSTIKSVLRQAAGSRKFFSVHTEVITGHETSRRKIPVNVSKPVSGTCNSVTNLWQRRNERRGFVLFIVQVQQRKGGRRRGDLLFPKRQQQEVTRAYRLNLNSVCVCEGWRLRKSNVFLR